MNELKDYFPIFNLEGIYFWKNGGICIYIFKTCSFHIFHTRLTVGVGLHLVSPKSLCVAKHLALAKRKTKSHSKICNYEEV